MKKSFEIMTKGLFEMVYQAYRMILTLVSMGCQKVIWVVRTRA